jgi:hypothetical protein
MNQDGHAKKFLLHHKRHQVVAVDLRSQNERSGGEERPAMLLAAGQLVYQRHISLLAAVQDAG